ncbi:MAG TPA: amidohydrolase family protein [candidate division Zixibacteria bacterium]|jgi:hypothetical protein
MPTGPLNLDYGVIDIHIHVAPWGMLHEPILEQLKQGRDRFEFLLSVSRDPQKLIALMDEAGIERVGVMNYVAPDIMGFTFAVNRFSADYARDHRDRIFAHGSVDPVGSTDPNGELSLLLDEWGISAIKIHPPHQGVAPNAYLSGNTILPVIYEGCQRRGVPVVFHTGTTTFKGARIKYGDPIHIDDVACDFPDLTIIMAHAGRPLWYQTARFLVRRHPNVYMDLSSIPPQSIPRAFPDLAKYADKVLWGTDWPGPGVPDMKTNLHAFLQLGYDPAMTRQILRDNAMRLFGWK